MYSKLLDKEVTLDKSRYYKQLKAIALWMKNNSRGSLAISGGVGKTLCGIIAIKRMQKKDINRTALIVVPTIPLCTSWEKELAKFNIKNATVLTIHTAVKTKIKYDLVILDEYHLFLSENRFKIFKSDCNWMLGLSGTPERLDGKHVKLKHILPIVYTLTYDQGIDLGYVLDVKVINLAVPVDLHTQLKINKFSKQINSSLKYFGDFKVMQTCLKSKGAFYFSKANNLDKNQVQKTANFGNYAVRQRKEILCKSKSKVETVKKLLEIFKSNRVLTFGLHTDICDELTNIYPNISCSYHSNLASNLKKVQKESIKKTVKEVEKFIKGKDVVSITEEENGKFIIKYNVDKKQTNEEVLVDILSKFINEKEKLRIINTALCLKQGISIDSLDVIINYARTSSFTDFDQIMWRGNRLHEGKVPIMINLYHPNTQDEKWLKNAQKNVKNVIYVESIDKFKQLYLNDFHC